MHPARSIILFTTAAGLGYGLAAMLGLGLLDAAQPATRAAHVLALALIAGGLVSSVFHLGNPQRAWRALSQWRSSWLSREGVLAIAAFVPLGVAAAASVFFGRHLPLVGLAGVVLSLASVYATAMLYASLRAIDAWHTWLTPASYLLLALCGGAGLAAAFAVASGQPARLLLVGAIALTLAALAVKTAWRRRMLATVPRSTPESATGLGFIGRVRMFEPPHSNPNYLTREMGFRIARKHAAKLWRIAVACLAVVPSLLWLALLASPEPAGLLRGGAAVAACVFQVLGLLIERWLFFAEARHAVSTYYDRRV